MIKIKLLPPLLLLGGILMSTAVVSAETISVEYKRFYSHVKKLNNEDTQALQFAFGFQHIHHDRLCVVNEAKIITEKQTLLLEVTIYILGRSQSSDTSMERENLQFVLTIILGTRSVGKCNRRKER